MSVVDRGVLEVCVLKFKILMKSLIFLLKYILVYVSNFIFYVYVKYIYKCIIFD